MLLQTDKSKNGIQFSTENIKISANREYLAEVFLKITKGRIAVKAVGAKTNKIYAFAVVNFEEWEKPEDAVQKVIKVPFAASVDQEIKISIFNESPNPPGSIVEINQMHLFDLGEASLTWTSPIRFVVRIIQKLFVTGIMLTLAVFGIVILLFRKERNVLIILFTIPAYFFLIQSVLHTEYRYVMAIHYFFFVFAAVFIEFIVKFISDNFRRLFEKTGKERNAN